MGSNISFKSQKKAARHLAFARDKLRCDLMLRGLDRHIPLPQSLPNFDEDEKDNSDSESTADSFGHTDDGIRDEEEDAQPEFCNVIPAVVSGQLSLEEQHAIRNFEFVHSTAEDMDLSDGLQDQGYSEEAMEDGEHIQSEEESTETYTYPDPEASELRPPPTPILSHAELPLSSIEIDTPNNDANELPDAVMEDLEDGDVSDITHLLSTDEPPHSSADSNAFNDRNEPTTDAAIHYSKDGKLAFIVHPNNTMSFWNVDARENTTNETKDAALEDSEDGDLSTRTHLPNAQPWWWQEFDDWLQDKERNNQPPVSGLANVAIHQDGSTKSPKTDLTKETLPEQPAAEEPSSPATPVAKFEQDATDDAVLALIMEDIAAMKAEAKATRARRERRQTRCRLHNALDSEHPTNLQVCRTRPRCVHLVSTSKPMPYTRKRIQEIKTERFPLPPWRKHCVWQRSLLARETKLSFLLDKKGLHKTWSECHEGRGVTGGDLDASQWKYCKLCEGDCRGV